MRSVLVVQAGDCDGTNKSCVGSISGTGIENSRGRTGVRSEIEAEVTHEIRMLSVRPRLVRHIIIECNRFDGEELLE